jgi:beta-glucanase (GH16 family)
MVGDTIVLQSLSNNKYVCADNGGNSPLIANRTSYSTWEQFKVIDVGGGHIALQSLANNLYVCADNGGNSPLIANRSTYSTWEQFNVIDAGGGHIALQSLSNNKYVCADNGGNSPLIANRTSYSTWEQYNVIVVVSGWGITWSDQFTGINNYPNSANWGYDLGGGGWGNNELEIYVNSWANAHVVLDGTSTDNQALQIEAQTDTNTWNGTWYSARITTNGRHLVPVNSYVEFRCKFPNSGQGYWPAAWMLGVVGGTWPACGEIDVAEEINGQWQNNQSLHMPGWDPTVVTSPNASTTTYHNYGAWWTPTSITFSVDGVNTATFSQGGGGVWEFNSNNQFYFLLNLAIGGKWPGNPNSSTQVNGNFYIDYVEQYNYH